MNKLRNCLAFGVFSLMVLPFVGEAITHNETEHEKPVLIQEAKGASTFTDCVSRTLVSGSYLSQVDSLSSSNKVQWYKYRTPSNGYFTFDFEHEQQSSTGTYWQVTPYYSDGTTKMDDAWNVKGNTNTNSFEYGLASNTEFYLKVEYYTSSCYGIEYTLKVNFTSTNYYEKEDNGTFLKATPINLNYEYGGNIAKTSDDDWYTFTITNKGYFYIGFKHDPLTSTNSYWKFTIYKDDGASSLCSGSYENISGTTAEFNSSIYGVDPGTYYLKVEDASYHSTKRYNISVNFTRTNYCEVEDNGTFLKASTISEFGKDYVGSISGTGDDDWYKFTTTTKGYFSVRFKHDILSSTNNYWKFTIYKDDGASSLCSGSYENIGGNNGDFESSIYGVNPGTYYLKVEDSSYHSTKTYSVAVNFTQTEYCEEEDNSTFLTATTLTSMNKDYKGSVAGTGDADWYKIVAPMTGSASLTFKHAVKSSTYSYWSISTYLSDGSTRLVSSVNSAGNKETTTVNLGNLTSGSTYYVKITYSSYHTTDTYSLSWDMPHTHSYTNFTSLGGSTHKKECRICGETTTETHKFSTTTTIPATHTSAGENTHRCTGCGYSYTSVIPAIETHSYVFTSIDDTNHSKTCECGINETEAHNYVLKETVSNAQGICTGELKECSDCGHEKLFVTNATHSLITEAEVPAGCETTGTSSYRHCSNCEYVETEPSIIEATGHTIVVDRIIGDKCTETWTEESHCSTCLETFTNTYESLGHDFSESEIVTHDPTCTEAGTKTRYCSRCHRDILIGTIPATGHTYTENIVEPTCTAKGYTEHTCACGDSYKDNYTDKIPHSYGEWVLDYAPTCVTPGARHKVCSCGDTINEDIPATGHTYGEWVVDAQPTCETSGSKHRTCACGDVAYEVIPATGHTYTETFVDPTCTAKGYTEHTCACGHSYRDSYIDETAQTYGEWVIDSEPTCVAAGSKHRTCSCGNVENETIPATGHTYVETYVAPTCTAKGYTEHTCACGHSYRDSYIDETAHTYGEWVVDYPATCETAGSRHKTCSCGDTITEAIPATGHNYVATTIDPTCQEKGYTQHTCACGVTYKDLYVNEIEHTYGEWIIDREATCSQAGSKHKTCACGDTITEEIPCTEHEFTEWETSKTATCEENGIMKRKCDCGLTEYKDIPATGHSFKTHVAIEAAPGQEGLSEVYCEHCGKVTDKTTIPALPTQEEGETMNMATLATIGGSAAVALGSVVALLAVILKRKK